MRATWLVVRIISVAVWWTERKVAHISTSFGRHFYKRRASMICIVGTELRSVQFVFSRYASVLNCICVLNCKYKAVTKMYTPGDIFAAYSALHVDKEL
jgi:hypothetical protein